MTVSHINCDSYIDVIKLTNVTLRNETSMQCKASLFVLDMSHSKAVDSATHRK